MKSIFEKIMGIISSLLKKEEVTKRVTTRPGWEDVVKMMYDTGLDAFGDEVVKVVYCKDKSMRYVILKDEHSIFTYQLEAIYQFDEDVWNFHTSFFLMRFHFTPI